MLILPRVDVWMVTIHIYTCTCIILVYGVFVVVFVLLLIEIFPQLFILLHQSLNYTQ